MGAKPCGGNDSRPCSTRLAHLPKLQRRAFLLSVEEGHVIWKLKVFDPEDA